MVIDDNKDYVTKSKLKTTVNTLSKCNDRSKVASKQTNKQTNKQKNRLRDKETGKHLDKKQKDTRIDAQTNLQWTHAQRELSKKKKEK